MSQFHRGLFPALQRIEIARRRNGKWEIFAASWHQLGGSHNSYLRDLMDHLLMGKAVSHMSCRELGSKSKAKFM